MKEVLIIGSGLGSLATALRLVSRGYRVTILEKYHQPGGRLNQLQSDGFKFDLGPSFMSMTYELDELFQDCWLKNPFELFPLDPLHRVYFAGREKPFRVVRNLDLLEKEFAGVEPGMADKAGRYLRLAKEFFHDTQGAVVKSNFNGLADYALKLTRVPPRHFPYLFRSLWAHVSRYFSSEEARVIFSLPSFFLGATPFQTPAIYSLLNYVELEHDGYWAVKGGIYRVVEELVRLLEEKGARLVYDTEVVRVQENAGWTEAVVDQNGKTWKADIFVCNADAASFRGLVLNRPGFRQERLDKMEWSMAPFTIYLGVKGRIPGLAHHNYFLGDNFREYARTIFTSTRSPQKPYYYANAPTRSHPEYAPPGCESIFILCPVPDLRYKKDWPDRDELARQIIDDFSRRVKFDVAGNLAVKKIWTPIEWGRAFNLYRGSGLGLCHGIWQIGALRPANKDEQLDNLYYVGASTIPGTGLPMVIIGSKLVTERIQNDFGRI